MEIDMKSRDIDIETDIGIHMDVDTDIETAKV